MDNKTHIFNYCENDKFHTNISFKILNKKSKFLSFEFVLIGNKNKFLRKKFEIRNSNTLVTIKLKEFKNEISEIGEYGILIIFAKKNIRNFLFNINPKNYLIKVLYTSVRSTAIKETKYLKGKFSIEKSISKDIFVLLSNTSFKYSSFDLYHFNENRISYNYSQRIALNPWDSKLIKLDKRKLENSKKNLLDFYIKGLSKYIIENLLIFYI